MIIAVLSGGGALGGAVLAIGVAALTVPEGSLARPLLILVVVAITALFGALVGLGGGIAALLSARNSRRWIEPVAVFVTAFGMGVLCYLGFPLATDPQTISTEK